MTRSMSIVAAAAALACLSGPVLAADFYLTYHVERIPTARLSLESCGSAVAEAASREGLEVSTQSFPGQLVTVSGGAEDRGAFVVQCIAVGDMTVSVVQGIDYDTAKGALGRFADDAFAAVKATAG